MTNECLQGLVTEALEMYGAKDAVALVSYNMEFNPVFWDRCKQNYGDHAFLVKAPTLWHKLPTRIQTASSLDTFKPLIKPICQSSYST